MRMVKLGTAVALTLIFIVVLTSNALAHAGEEHSNPVTAILHQGTSALAVTLIIIGLTGMAIWLYGRRSSTTRFVKPDR